MFARTIVGPDATDLSPLWGFPFIGSFFLGLAPQAKIYRRSAAFMKEKLSWTRVILNSRFLPTPHDRNCPREGGWHSKLRIEN